VRIVVLIRESALRAGMIGLSKLDQLQLKATSSPRPRLRVSADGRGVVGHAGTRMLANLAEATGLESGFIDALADASAFGRRRARAGTAPRRTGETARQVAWAQHADTTKEAFPQAKPAARSLAGAH